MKELSLYIHIPFCHKSKCTYCSFVSFCDKEDKIDEYLDMLSREMKLYADECKDRLVKTIFIGGGTPSVLSSYQVSYLMSNVKKYFSITNDCEITIECNIDTLTEEKLATYKRLGINRISIGAQSMNDFVLSAIGRRHNADDIISAVKLIKKFNFNSFNVDMMVGLPHQSIDDVRKMVGFLITQGVPHISCYSLILEEGTILFESAKSGRVSLPSEDEAVKMYDEAYTLLSHNNYTRYEVSNFAKTGHECRHNLVYWLGGDYLGLGVSAHSYIKMKRFSNTDTLDDYISILQDNEKPIIYEEVLDITKAKEEYIMLRLRTRYGINLTEFQEKFNENLLKTRENEINFLKNNDFIEIVDNNLKINNNAYYVMDSIILKLI